MCLSIGNLLLVCLSIWVSCFCAWEIVILCDYSVNLLGSARGTKLLPDCGRNQDNCLCFSHFISFIFAAYDSIHCSRLWTLSDSRLSLKEEKANPPSCVFITFKKFSGKFKRSGYINIWIAFSINMREKETKPSNLNHNLTTHFNPFYEQYSHEPWMHLTLIEKNMWCPNKKKNNLRLHNCDP